MLAGELGRATAAAYDRCFRRPWLGNSDPAIISCANGIGDSICGREGTFCATVGAVDETTIKAYIENQQWDEDEQGFKITAPTEP